MGEARKFIALTRRNIKRYFKDKLLFLVSLITPMILLLLFATFLKSVYMNSFENIFKAFGFTADRRLANGLAGCWLMSSVVSVSAVTVAFCSNAVMIQDKIDGTIDDFLISPVSGYTLQLSYFAANFLVTAIVIFALLFVGLIYIAIVGWCLTFLGVIKILLDSLCCVLFGTLLAAIVESFISTQGGLSAVSTLVSALYGFICGAYMPLSQFSAGMRNFLCLLPGTYGVGIVRNHFMADCLDKLVKAGLPEAGKKSLMDGFDANLYLFSHNISVPVMYLILLGTCAVLLAAYIAVILIRGKNRKFLSRRGKTNKK